MSKGRMCLILLILAASRQSATALRSGGPSTMNASPPSHISESQLIVWDEEHLKRQVLLLRWMNPHLFRMMGSHGGYLQKRLGTAFKLEDSGGGAEEFGRVANENSRVEKDF